MKKFNFTKIVSLALVCAMLMGAFMFTTFAADEATVEIVAKNVWYGEKYQLMFAYNAPVGATVSATVNGQPVDIETYELTEEDEVDADYACMVSEGVAAQAIDTVVTFTVAYGEETATVDYSVLQYVYERMYVSANKAEGAELAMFKALLAYADAASIFFNTTDDDETNNDKNIADLVYVNATDCTFDGKTAGMVQAGETVKFVSSITAGAGKVINFEVTNILTGSTATITAESMAESGYVVNGPVSVAVVEADDDAPVYTDKTYSYTFASGAFSKVGTAKLNGIDWTLSGSVGFFGMDNASSGRGFQFGSKSSPCTSMELASVSSFANVSVVKINTCGYQSGSVKVYVGDTLAGTINFNNSAKEYTINVDNLSGEIRFVCTNAARAYYIKSIGVEYQVEVE